jgi:phosphatidylglycerophosphatase A
LAYTESTIYIFMIIVEKCHISRLELVLITGLGTGYLRPASGTWGSLPPVALALGLVSLGAAPRAIDASLAFCGILFAGACLISGERAEAHFCSKDPKSVVADEFAGQSLALMWLPWHEGLSMRNAILAACAFLLFRAFDVLKPPPARQFERLPGGTGILLDDVAAGAMASIAMLAISRLLDACVYA